MGKMYLPGKSLTVLSKMNVFTSSCSTWNCPLGLAFFVASLATKILGPKTDVNKKISQEQLQNKYSTQIRKQNKCKKIISGATSKQILHQIRKQKKMYQFWMVLTILCVAVSNTHSTYQFQLKHCIESFQIFPFAGQMQIEEQKHPFQSEHQLSRLTFHHS